MDDFAYKLEGTKRSLDEARNAIAQYEEDPTDEAESKVFVLLAVLSLTMSGDGSIIDLVKKRMDERKSAA